MKSLMRIYVRYIVTAFILVFAFIIIQIVILSAVTRKVYQQGKEEHSVKEVYAALRKDQKEGEAYLREMNAAFAMLLNEEGCPVWSYNLPESLEHSYSINQVASFSRWYLADYPVSVWGDEIGLLVIGYPKGSVWNYYIHQDMKGVEGVLTFLSWSMAVTFFGCILIFLVCGFRYYRRIKGITSAIDQLAEGGTVHLAESKGIKEIACSINRTSDRLKRQRMELERRDEARTEWISGVSHDIRTPLSLILGYADMIEGQPGIDPDSKRRAEGIRRQSIRIRKLIEDLNLASKLEYHMQPLRLKPVALASVLRSAAAEVLNSLEKPEIFPLQAEIEPDFEGVFIQGDEQLLFRAFQNILGNSVGHNQQGCRIFIRAWIQEGRPEICFSDEGKGIPEDICRFLDEGLLPEPKVHLMGLKIVKRIVEGNGGQIKTGKNGHELFLRFSLENFDNRRRTER